MRETQIGLLVAAPMIVTFAAFMFRKGLLPLGGLIVSGLATIAIAVVLFLSH